MLLNKIVDSEKLIQDVLVKENAVSEYNQFARGATTLEEILSNCKNYTEMCTVLHQQDECYFAYTDLSPIISLIDELLTTVESNQPLPSQKVRKINELVNIKENDLKSKWDTYVSLQTNEIITLLNQTLSLLDDSRATQEVLNNIQFIKKKWPFGNDLLRTLEEVLVQAKLIVQELGAGKDVIDFLQAVTDRRARVSDLTPSVINWLNQHGFAKKLTISFEGSRRGIYEQN